MAGQIQQEWISLGMDWLQQVGLFSPYKYKVNVKNCISNYLQFDLWSVGRSVGLLNAREGKISTYI